MLTGPAICLVDLGSVIFIVRPEGESVAHERTPHRTACAVAELMELDCR